MSACRSGLPAAPRLGLPLALSPGHTLASSPASTSGRPRVVLGPHLAAKLRTVQHMPPLVTGSGLRGWASHVGLKSTSCSSFASRQVATYGGTLSAADHGQSPGASLGGRWRPRPR
ncbi:hypothetical protein EMIHUDRAFT_360018 [Emiliania huxleyi CCMP1516]|uniref:Uncharacterized protein n=2 Tax=Emiliania huxleyi TaxID=2903 RepID=A0A0D3I1Q4_EMIH1|nr:hypothetical protein EMIHUDRAFT_360018 [Emiliania huxleyi CCMP1516]EOD05189.1 hypothetical protein EMIHUDRAFT_360018 [Emiliania huxleyi CCMP1516]|eukprot:XP_005757618.1 hypothetical protein EMIHUDRAFT_360018 [Emiliania huxleyi CCMP1516]